MHPREEAFEREVAEFTDGQSQSLSTLADGRIPKSSLWPTVKDLTNGVPVQLGGPGEIFLIPALLLKES